MNEHVRAGSWVRTSKGKAVLLVKGYLYSEFAFRENGTWVRGTELSAYIHFDRGPDAESLGVLRDWEESLSDYEVEQELRKAKERILEKTRKVTWKP